MYLLLCFESTLDRVNEVSSWSCAEGAVVAMRHQNASKSVFLFLNGVFLAVCSAVRSLSLQLEIPVEKFVAYTIKSLPEVHLNL